MTFEELNLAPEILQALQEMGFENPTPIQQEAIPAILSGVDIMAAAQTGTGKTGGFGLPILHRLANEAPAKNKRGRVVPRALVIAPTRELAAQIEESFRSFAKYLKLKTIVVYGGVSMNPQIQRLQRGVDVIIATPGRLLDLQNQGFVDLSQAQSLVLDEADRMLDMGFIDDIKKIIALMPDERQNLLFSATFSGEIRELAKELLHEPHTIDIAPRNSTVELIEQVAHPVARARKLELLIKLIEENQWYQVLVFTRTKNAANRISEVLEKQGINSSALHGNKSQAARTAAMRDFKNGRVQVLVATDIAARGIDIDQLACVINYDLPNVSEDYVHRIGRTGRAGSEGVAISLVTVDEAGFMQDIERLIKREVDKVEIEGFTPASTETAMPIVMGRQVIWGGIGKAPSRRQSNSYVKEERKNFSKPRRSSGGGGGRPGGRPGRRDDDRDNSEARGERRNARSPGARFAGPDSSGGRDRDDRGGSRSGFRFSDNGGEGRSANRGERSDDGRPSRSGDGRPSRSGESRPSRSGESRPSRSGESRPSRSGESRPSRSGEGRPSRSGEGRPSRSGESRPSRSGESRPSRSGESRPSRSGESRPSRSGESRPSRSGEGRPASRGNAGNSPVRRSRPARD